MSLAREHAMIDDITINKASVIRRCLARVREEYREDATRLLDFTVQDSIVLNLLRSCEAAIDLAMHLVAVGKLGVPQSSRDAFTILQNGGVLSSGTTSAMKRMIGFRNIAVHDYQAIELPVLSAILKYHLGDFESLLKEISNAKPPAGPANMP